MSKMTRYLGKIIHHCGMVELLVSQQLKNLSTDPLLVDEVIKYPLQKRADLLKKLIVRSRPDLETEFIENLFSDIRKLGEERNIVAHNPITTIDRKSREEKIFFFRKDVRHEYSDSDLERIFLLSISVVNTLQRIQKPIP